jgi:hypothetical protein
MQDFVVVMSRKVPTNRRTRFIVKASFPLFRSGRSEKEVVSVSAPAEFLISRRRRSKSVPSRLRQLMPSPTRRSIQRQVEKKDRSTGALSSNVVNVHVVSALAVVLAEVEADAALLLAAVGVGLVDLGGLGEFAVGLE